MSRFFPRHDLYFATARRPNIAVSELNIPGSPDWLKGRTALFASDFHLLPCMDPAPIAALMAGCEADLILLGGDYADQREQALRLFNAFKRLRAPLGIFAVCGNNDAEAFDGCGALRDALAGFGARLLINESVSISCGDGTLRLGGMDEYKYGAPNGENLFSEGDGYRILLSHYPILPDCACPPDLMLSGHTHGGQFNLLGLTPYAIGFERIGELGKLAPAMVSGSERFGRTTLLVSKGVGTSRIPLRIGVRPEIHRIRFC